MIVISDSKAHAATRTDTFTYTGWSTPDAATVAAVPPFLWETSNNIGLRTPNTNTFNPTLNDPYNSVTTTDNTKEVGAVMITPSYICSDQTPLTVNIGGFNITRDRVNDDVNGDGNKDTELAAVIMSYLDYGHSTNETPQQYGFIMTNDPSIDPTNNTSGFGNYSVSSTFAGVPANTPLVMAASIGRHEPYGYASSYIATTPTITLTYDDSGCTRRNNNAPVISGANANIRTNTSAGTVIINGSSLLASDSDGDILSYSIVSGNSNNYFSINSSNGNISTNSSNIPTGTYSLNIKVSDGHGGESNALVKIAVSGSNVTLASTNTTLPMTGLGAISIATLLTITLTIYFILTMQNLNKKRILGNKNSL